MRKRSIKWLLDEGLIGVAVFDLHVRVLGAQLDDRAAVVLRVVVGFGVGGGGDGLIRGCI